MRLLAFASRRTIRIATKTESGWSSGPVVVSVLLVALLRNGARLKRKIARLIRPGRLSTNITGASGTLT